MLLQLFKSLTHPVYRIISYLQCNAHSQKHIIILFSGTILWHTVNHLSLQLIWWVPHSIRTVIQVEQYFIVHEWLQRNIFTHYIRSLFLLINHSFWKHWRKWFVCKAVWRSLSVSSLILLCKESYGSLQLHQKETQTHLAGST